MAKKNGVEAHLVNRLDEVIRQHHSKVISEIAIPLLQQCINANAFKKGLQYAKMYENRAKRLSDEDVKSKFFDTANQIYLQLNSLEDRK